jgi:hypothetical protein
VKTTKINEKGKRYGRLVVLKEWPHRTKRQDVCWRCRCDCGNIAISNLFISVLAKPH